jgi:hypothetical protein
MLCPKCNEEMEAGYLKSSHPILWCNEKDSGLLNSDHVKISHGFWSGCFADASICRRCGILIANLPDKKDR